MKFIFCDELYKKIKNTNIKLSIEVCKLKFTYQKNKKKIKQQENTNSTKK